MFTHKDIETRTIFVINCITHNRSFRVQNGELLLEELNKDSKKTLTKFPFQKILALFIIGHATITTPLIEKCHRYNVAIVVMKPNLRPVFYWSNTAEANFLLRQHQYAVLPGELSIAKWLVANKLSNQLRTLLKTRRKDALTLQAIDTVQLAIQEVNSATDTTSLMGIEGLAAKSFFSAYYNDLGWYCRRPRVKTDPLNVTLDIGYTILFNLVEAFLRMFGFDLYVGVYHRLWFKRKSLVCDLMEPFRCIIDHAVLLAYHRNQFKVTDFKLRKTEYYLIPEKSGAYYQVFYEALIPFKSQMFQFVQQFYRCFMGCKSVKNYPNFEF